MIFAIRPVELTDYDDLRPLMDPRDPEPKAREVFAQLLGDDRWAIIGRTATTSLSDTLPPRTTDHTSDMATSIGPSGCTT